MDNKLNIPLNRLQLLKLALSITFVSKKQKRYELIDSKYIAFDGISIGGNKLVYRIYTEYPRILRLLWFKIKLNPKIENIETAIFFKPLKKYWPNIDSLPYEIRGNNSSPFLNRWLRIKQDFADIQKEIKFIRIKEIITDKELSINLNLVSKKFISINS